MTRAWLLLTVALAAPAFAQDEPTAGESAEVVPVEESAGDFSDEAAPAETSSEDPYTEDASAEPVEEGEPWQLYAGIDHVVNTLSLSGRDAESGNELDTGMYRLRLGRRVFEVVGLELHYGLDNSDDEPGSIETESYYGAFVVPTATLFETLELAFPVGYAKTSLGDDAARDDLASIAYGADLELPLRALGESLPDLRLTGGGMVYYQKSDARLYGFNFGLRYDFTAAGFGNPFSGLDLWPFGDEEAPAE